MQGRKLALYLPSLDGGGAERVFVQLANHFTELGFTVDLVLANRRGHYLDEIAPEVDIVDLDAPRVIRSLPKLVRYLRTSRPTALLAGLDHANIVAVLARYISFTRVRCIVSMRSVPTAVYSNDRSIRRWIMLQLIRTIYPFSDSIIANSNAVKDDLSRSLRIGKHKIHVIYNPLDLNKISGQAGEFVDHAWLGAEEVPFVIAIGSLAILKDFPTLLRAFAIVRQVRECRLVILGEGPDRGALEKLIEKLGIRSDVEMPGFVNNPFPWLKKASVYVSSSLTEGCPNSLMQALACGTAVVGTDCVGGSAEILEHGKWGSLVQPGNAGEMAEAILAALDAPSARDTTQRANDFSLSTIAADYLRILVPPDSRGESARQIQADG